MVIPNPTDKKEDGKELQNPAHKEDVDFVYENIVARQKEFIEAEKRYIALSTNWKSLNLENGKVMAFLNELLLVKKMTTSGVEAYYFEQKNNCELFLEAANRFGPSQHSPLNNGCIGHIRILVFEAVQQAAKQASHAHDIKNTYKIWKSTERTQVAVMKFLFKYRKEYIVNFENNALAKCQLPDFDSGPIAIIKWIDEMCRRDDQRDNYLLKTNIPEDLGQSVEYGGTHIYRCYGDYSLLLATPGKNEALAAKFENPVPVQVSHPMMYPLRSPIIRQYPQMMIQVPTPVFGYRPVQAIALQPAANSFVSPMFQKSTPLGSNQNIVYTAPPQQNHYVQSQFQPDSQITPASCPYNDCVECRRNSQTSTSTMSTASQSSPPTGNAMYAAPIPYFGSNQTNQNQFQQQNQPQQHQSPNQDSGSYPRVRLTSIVDDFPSQLPNCPNQQYQCSSNGPRQTSLVPVVNATPSAPFVKDMSQLQTVPIRHQSSLYMPVQDSVMPRANPMQSIPFVENASQLPSHSYQYQGNPYSAIQSAAVPRTDTRRSATFVETPRDYHGNSYTSSPGSMLNGPRPTTEPAKPVLEYFPSPRSRLVRRRGNFPRPTTNSVVPAPNQTNVTHALSVEISETCDVSTAVVATEPMMCVVNPTNTLSAITVEIPELHDEQENTTAAVATESEALNVEIPDNREEQKFPIASAASSVEPVTEKSSEMHSDNDECASLGKQSAVSTTSGWNGEIASASSGGSSPRKVTMEVVKRKAEVVNVVADAKKPELSEALKSSPEEATKKDIEEVGSHFAVPEDSLSKAQKETCEDDNASEIGWEDEAGPSNRMPLVENNDEAEEGNAEEGKVVLEEEPQQNRLPTKKTKKVKKNKKGKPAPPAPLSKEEKRRRDAEDEKEMRAQLEASLIEWDVQKNRVFVETKREYVAAFEKFKRELAVDYDRMMVLAGQMTNFRLAKFRNEEEQTENVKLMIKSYRKFQRRLNVGNQLKLAFLAQYLNDDVFCCVENLTFR